MWDISVFRHSVFYTIETYLVALIAFTCEVSLDLFNLSIEHSGWAFRICPSNGSLVAIQPKLNQVNNSVTQR